MCNQLCSGTCSSSRWSPTLHTTSSTLEHTRSNTLEHTTSSTRQESSVWSSLSCCTHTLIALACASPFIHLLITAFKEDDLNIQNWRKIDQVDCVDFDHQKKLGRLGKEAMTSWQKYIQQISRKRKKKTDSYSLIDLNPFWYFVAKNCGVCCARREARALERDLAPPLSLQETSFSSSFFFFFFFSSSSFFSSSFSSSSSSSFFFFFWPYFSFFTQQNPNQNL